MASNAERILGSFRLNCGNFIYLFIADSAVSYFNAKIRQKRKEQMDYVRNTAQFSSLSYDQIKQAVADAIRVEYGMTAAEALLKMADGKNVYSRTGVRIGGVAYVGAAVNETTGFPEGTEISSYDSNLSADGRYEKIYDCETETPIGIVDTQSGAQVSSYNSTTQKFQTGESTGEKKKNFWMVITQLMPFIQSVIEWLGSFFGVKPAAQVSASQSDGWGPSGTTTNKSIGLPTILVIGGIAYLVSKD